MPEFSQHGWRCFCSQRQHGNALSKQSKITYGRKFSSTCSDNPYCINKSLFLFEPRSERGRDLVKFLLYSTLLQYLHMSLGFTVHCQVIKWSEVVSTPHPMGKNLRRNPFWCGVRTYVSIVEYRRFVSYDTHGITFIHKSTYHLVSISQENKPEDVGNSRPRLFELWSRAALKWSIGWVTYRRSIWVCQNKKQKKSTFNPIRLASHHDSWSPVPPMYVRSLHTQDLIGIYSVYGPRTTTQEWKHSSFPGWVQVWE